MIEKILDILKRARAEFTLKEIYKEENKEKNMSYVEYVEKEYFFQQEKDVDCHLYYGDNLDIMKCLKKNDKRVDLIYIDPPFASKANYSTKFKLRNENNELVKFNSLVYRDNWKEDIIGYFEMLIPRLILMKELLSDKGSIYVHVDWHASHYVKIVLDEIFGREHFINEIIWNYKSGGASKKRFSRKHDTIFLYSKTNEYIFNSKKEKSYNRGYKKYGFKGVEEYMDENGWYTLVNMKDTWDIDMVGRTSKERVEYATQKPIKLLERIIEISSNEDSIVADFFSGSGTTALVAANLGRKSIAVDSSIKSISTIQNRLLDNRISFSYYENIRKKYESNFKVACGLINDKVEVDNIVYNNVDKLPIKKKERECFINLLPLNTDIIIDRVLRCRLNENRFEILGSVEDFNRENCENQIYKIVDIFGNYVYVKKPLV